MPATRAAGEPARSDAPAAGAPGGQRGEGRGGGGAQSARSAKLPTRRMGCRSGHTYRQFFTHPPTPSHILPHPPTQVPAGSGEPGSAQVEEDGRGSGQHSDAAPPDAAGWGERRCVVASLRPGVRYRQQLLFESGSSRGAYTTAAAAAPAANVLLPEGVAVMRVGQKQRHGSWSGGRG